MSATKAFNVYINGHCINRVYHTPNTQPDEVRLSLINHDGYDPNIKGASRQDRRTLPYVVEEVQRQRSLDPAPPLIMVWEYCIKTNRGGATTKLQWLRVRAETEREAIKLAGRCYGGPLPQNPDPKFHLVKGK